MSEHESGGTDCDRVAWWCVYCLENVGTQGDEPDECPTCGHSDGWEELANRSQDTDTDRGDINE